MKKYRTTKTWWDGPGNKYKLQGVGSVGGPFGDELRYFIKDRYGSIHYINPEALIEAGADWIEEVKEERWRAERGGAYWYVDLYTSKVCLGTSVEDGSITDNNRYKLGNYFKTEEETQKVVDEINSIFERMRDESNEKS